MGTITSGVGLISGIDTASLIDSLIALQSRGQVALQTQVASLQTQQAALLDINARLLSLQNVAEGFRQDSIFRSALANSSNESIVTAAATTKAQPGNFQFVVKQLVSTSQTLSGGFIDRDTAPVGLSQLSFEFGQGRLDADRELESLRGGSGISRGRISITDRAGNQAQIDLTDVTTMNEVIDRINDSGEALVTASVEGDHLVITDVSGQSGALSVTSVIGDTTAADLGIQGSVVGDVLTGTDINFLGGATALSTMNDGTGVLVRDNVDDLQIEARDGTIFNIDLGRVNTPITTDTLLEDLNNGAGITITADSENPDLKFIDKSGAAHDVDLSGVTTVGGLIGRITSETGGDITLSVHADGDRFTVTDNTGGGGLLQVVGAGTNGSATAEDLGILEETGVGANTFDGDLVPNKADLAPAATIQNVVDRINSAQDELEVDNGGRIVAAIAADGVSLEITDTTGGTGSLSVQSTAANPFAAAQLGIEQSVAADTISGRRLIAELNSVLVTSLNGGAGIVAAAGTPATLSGSTLLDELFNGSGITTNNNPGSVDMRVRDRDGTNYNIELDGLTTVQDLIDTVNTATGGTVVLSIDGQALRATDTTGGSGNLRIQNRNGALVATELGIEINDPVDTVLGVDTDPVGSGVAVLTVNNRLGTGTDIDLSAETSVSGVIALINAAGAGVTASLNRAGNGVAITDTSGGTGNLTISGNAASELGIEADVAADTVEGSNLQVKYVAESSRLEDLNYGRGVGTGTFKITDGLGESAEVNIGSDSKTLYDIATEINSRGLAINARVNDNGDGLLIEESLDVDETAFTKIKIESVSGTTARDLNILGESEVVEGGFIDGSYERTVNVTASDTLDDLVEKIAASGAPVSASVINTGSGTNPYRLSLTSQITGTGGEMIIDTGGVDIGLISLASGQDAKVFFGSADPESGFLLTSPANSLADVVQGVTIDLHQASTEPVTVTVERDQETIVSTMQELVDAFNSVVSTIDQYDFFDVDSEQRGALLGNATAQRVRQDLYRVIQQRADGVSGGLQYLSQVGVTIGAEGLLEFNQERFDQAYANDPDAVEALFATFQATTGSVEEVAPGVTVTNDTQTIIAQGFGDLLTGLAERLTNSIDGTITVASKGFDSRIDLLNQRIEEFDVRLAARRARLEAEFAAMEAALAQLQGQSSALSGIGANVALSQSLIAR